MYVKNVLLVSLILGASQAQVDPHAGHNHARSSQGGIRAGTRDILPALRNAFGGIGSRTSQGSGPSNGVYPAVQAGNGVSQGSLPAYMGGSGAAQPPVNPGTKGAAPSDGVSNGAPRGPAPAAGTGTGNRENNTGSKESNGSVPGASNPVLPPQGPVPSGNTAGTYGQAAQNYPNENAPGYGNPANPGTGTSALESQITSMIMAGLPVLMRALSGATQGTPANGNNLLGMFQSAMSAFSSRNGLTESTDSLTPEYSDVINVPSVGQAILPTAN